MCLAPKYYQISFKDVPANVWYSDAVSFTAARGIVKGTGNSIFSPEAELNRGDFTVMVMRAYGIKPDVIPVNNFSDAGKTYYTGYLSAAKRLGITGGVGNNKFAPERKLTNQEMYVLLYNTLKAVGELPEAVGDKTVTGFSDEDQVAVWAKAAVKLFSEGKIVSSSEGKLNPTKNTSRAQMAQVLYNLLSK